MSSVFISYSSKDRETALKVKAALESHGISVTIDLNDLKGNITEFIERSVRENNFTLTIISEHSLNSAWVSQEGITTIYGEKFTGEQKYIACYLDVEFLQDDYIVRASAMINAEIKRLEKLKKQADREGAIPKNLESKINRLKYHKGNLGDILDRLQGDRTFDIRDQQFENSISQIVEIILPDSTKINGSFRAKEIAYLEALRHEMSVDLTKYTPLAGKVTERPIIRPVYEHKPLQKLDMGLSSSKPSETRRFEDAVGEILRLKRAVVLGEPGAGKTTTLWKLAGDLISEALVNSKAPLPLLIRLGRWTEDTKPLMNFLGDQLDDLVDGLGGQLDRLLSENRAILLLDGLNELPSGQRKGKTSEISELISKWPDVTVIISCRLLDYKQNELDYQPVEIVPLDHARIRQFLCSYLGNERGDLLFWRLAGGQDLRLVFEKWQHAGASFDQFWTAPDIPRENPNVYAVTNVAEDKTWRDKVLDKNSLVKLAYNPFMLMMIYSIYDEETDTLPDNRAKLFEIFAAKLFEREKVTEEDQEQLKTGLAQVAYEMQTRRTKQQEGDALTVLPRIVIVKLLEERLTTIATRASILSPGEEVRFTHQLLQEYFAARQMDAEIKAGKLVASNLWPAASWWERNNWEEATVLLAGFYDNDCTEVINWVADANPEVAAMCIKKSGAICPPATLEDLRRRWLPRLTNLQRDPDPRARAAVGRALGMTGLDNRPGVGVTNKSGVVLPDIDWVDIEGGEFEYGDDDQSDNPRQRLTLESFRISRYPITYRQFQVFIDDPEGMRNDRWLAGLDCDMKKEQEPGEQAFPFDNHPRERVSWYQAIAFCRWLSWRLGGEYDLDHVDRWMIRLPTEFEWERAARGRKGRKYAYGDKYDPSLGNTYDTRIGQTSAVGIFPHGASPDKVIDMTGNVWEWCLGTYKHSQIDPALENLAAGGNRLVRGGSWDNSQDFARAASRSSNHPALRGSYYGVRVVFGLRPPSLKH